MTEKEMETFVNSPIGCKITDDLITLMVCDRNPNITAVTCVLLTVEGKDYICPIHDILEKFILPISKRNPTDEVWGSFAVRF